MLVNNLLYKTLSRFGYKVVPKHRKVDATAELMQLFEIELPVEKYFHCHKGWKVLRDLKEMYGATLALNDEKQAVISFSNFHFILQTWEEIYVLQEIFINGIYNVNVKNDFLLIDIGMNVGFASIYFSGMENCKQVISFEPFTNTIAAAKKNLALNAPLASKINIQQTGLGYPERTVQVNYSDNHKGSVGINGIPDYVDVNAATYAADLPIADVFATLQPYLQEKALKKVIKLDCEGAEYEIIERLATTHLLQKIDILMIEWHLKGADELKNHLQNAGFTMFSFNEHSKTIGMLYAFKCAE